MNLSLYLLTVLIWGTTWIALKWQLGVVEIPVSIAENPMECVALGTGLMLEAKENIFRQRKQNQLAGGKNSVF